MQSPVWTQTVARTYAQDKAKRSTKRVSSILRVRTRRSSSWSRPNLAVSSRTLTPSCICLSIFLPQTKVSLPSPALALRFFKCSMTLLACSATSYVAVVSNVSLSVGTNGHTKQRIASHNHPYLVAPAPVLVRAVVVFTALPLLVFGVLAFLVLAHPAKVVYRPAGPAASEFKTAYRSGFQQTQGKRQPHI